MGVLAKHRCRWLAATKSVLLAQSGRGVQDFAIAPFDEGLFDLSSVKLTSRTKFCHSCGLLLTTSVSPISTSFEALASQEVRRRTTASTQSGLLRAHSQTVATRHPA